MLILPTACVYEKTQLQAYVHCVALNLLTLAYLSRKQMCSTNRTHMFFILGQICTIYWTISFFSFSFRRELFVMHSLRICCKILCQNLVVHPKCMLGGSTRFHAFHVLQTPPPNHPPTHPSPRNGNLGFKHFQT